MSSWSPEPHELFPDNDPSGVENYELDDFNPTTGHLRQCKVFDCDCATHLYTIAAEIHNDKIPVIEDVNETVNKFHIPEQDIRMDIFSNEAEQSVRLTHLPTGESATYLQKGFFNTNGISYLKEMALFSLYRKESVINYYNPDKTDQ